MRIFLWKDHAKHIKKNVFESIGIFYEVRDYLSKQSLSSLYYAYIDTSLNSANIL